MRHFIVLNLNVVTFFVSFPLRLLLNLEEHDKRTKEIAELTPDS